MYHINSIPAFICIVGLLLYIIFSSPKLSQPTVSTIGRDMYMIGGFWWMYLLIK
jgi:hypothetical protein